MRLSIETQMIKDENIKATINILEAYRTNKEIT